MFGRQTRLPIDTSLIPKENLPHNVKEHVDNLNQQLQLTELIVQANRLGQQVKQKENYDRNSKQPSFEIGQKVLVRKENITPGLSKKLTKKFIGPYEIVEKGPNYTFKLKLVENDKLMKSLVNANRLKPFNESDRLPENTDDQVAPNVADHIVNPVPLVPEKIIKFKRQNGLNYYRVKWINRDATHNAWVLEESVPLEMREDYHAKFYNNNKKKPKKLVVYKRR